MVPRNSQRFGIAFERARGKSADDKSWRLKSAMRARREMNSFAHKRPEIFDVEFEDRMGSLPTNNVQGAKIVEHRGVLTAATYPEFPFRPLLGHRLGLGCFDHVVIERRVM